MEDVWMSSDSVGEAADDSLSEPSPSVVGELSTLERELS